MVLENFKNKPLMRSEKTKAKMKNSIKCIVPDYIFVKVVV
jgi:hypothetical protein|tara:strand:- start:1811 stop:1930 length:120 start_codon:yes stop_codon:yes gene_type:complete